VIESSRVSIKFGRPRRVLDTRLANVVEPCREPSSGAREPLRPSPQTANGRTDRLDPLPQAASDGSNRFEAAVRLRSRGRIADCSRVRGCLASSHRADPAVRASSGRLASMLPLRLPSICPRNRSRGCRLAFSASAHLRQTTLWRPSSVLCRCRLHRKRNEDANPDGWSRSAASRRTSGAMTPGSGCRCDPRAPGLRGRRVSTGSGPRHLVPQRGRS
jgi:hypothetical protein